MIFAARQWKKAFTMLSDVIEVYGLEGYVDY